MVYRIAAIILMAAFYGIYFFKMYRQGKKGIVTDQIGKGEKHTKGYYIEKVMQIITFLVPFAELASILYGGSAFGIMGKIIGIYLAFTGDIIFGMAVIAMGDSWRAGVAEKEKRDMVTEGIYRYSRNPAFLGFDLVYLGILLMYFNPVLLIVTLAAITILHLQILEEENFLTRLFGSSYTEYRDRVCRYAGYGRLTPDKVLMYVYFLLVLWSIYYYFTCLIYGGIHLSWAWLWLLIAAFSAVRVKMLKDKIDGNEKFQIPGSIKTIYRFAILAFLAVFIPVEAKIIDNMTAIPRQDLEYIVVLGAGLKGREPRNPLRARIERAGENMKENTDTLLLASGGKGKYEEISEAECIREQLIEWFDIGEERIIMEDRSTDTEENLQNTLEIIGDPKASVGIVTNGFHEYRAMILAKQKGYENASPVPAVTLFPVGIHYVVREFFGVMECWLKYGIGK